MRYNDFAKKNYKTKTKVISGKKKLRYVFLLVLLLCCYCYKPVNHSLANFSAKLKNQAVNFVKVREPRQWLFFDLGQHAASEVRLHQGKLGLRLVNQLSLSKCKLLANSLISMGLPAFWLSKPSLGKGLCRVDIGPYDGLGRVFIVRDELFRKGFYGNIQIVNWLGVFRSFRV